MSRDSNLSSAIYKVRRMTFDAMHADIPLHQLPVVQTGDLASVQRWCARQHGFVFKPSRKYLFGGYYYNKEESVCLLVT